MLDLSIFKSQLRRIYDIISWYFRGIKVYALVGKSGTGKSFRAQMVARRFSIPLIIDDGLLIKGNVILAGKSAKKANGKIQALKCAIFHDQSHRKEIMRALQAEKFSLILILGTSQKMVDMIANRLNLPSIIKIIHIEDIASDQEIALALNSRKKGEHVIPVPSVAMTGDYSQIFYNSIKILFKKPFWKRQSPQYEKSIVKPSFARIGVSSISQNAVLEMIRHAVDELDPHIKIDRIRIRHGDENHYSFYISVIIPYYMEILSMIENLKERIRTRVERYANIELENIDITVKGVIRD